MQFRSKQDVDAPLERVFERVSDFAAIERLALKRGAVVTRTDAGTDPAAAAWRSQFQVRGRARRVEARVIRFDPPKGYVISGTSDGFDIGATMDLIALSADSTRIILNLTLGPRTMTARLLAQSMKLAKGNIERRLDARLAEFVRGIERGTSV